MQPEYSYSVKVAMLEIYNEEVRDLLSSNGINGGHEVWEGASAVGGAGGKLEIRRDQDGVVQVRGNGDRNYRRRSSYRFVSCFVFQTGFQPCSSHKWGLDRVVPRG